MSELKKERKKKRQQHAKSKLVRIFKWYETDANANDAMQMCKRDQKRCVSPTRSYIHIYATVTAATAYSMFRLEIVMAIKNNSFFFLQRKEIY